MRRIAISSAIGILLAISMAALSYLADVAGASILSKILLWPNSLLQSFTPLYNIGIAERPIYEGTPLNFIAFVASFPLAALIYGIAAYFVIGRGKRHT